MPFWQILEDVLNKHFRALCVLDWDISKRMSIIIDNDKYHLNCKIPTDNLHFIRHIRDSLISLVNYAPVLTASSVVVRVKYGK